VILPWRIHCQICEREISPVAASSISSPGASLVIGVALPVDGGYTSR
jgi:hypothetical protein